MKLQAKFRSICNPKTINAFALGFPSGDFHTRYKDTPIKRYNTVQTGPKR
jgi:hypothetical protein